MFLGLQGALTSSLELKGSLYPVLASQARWGKVKLVLVLAAGTILERKLFFLASVGPLNVSPQNHCLYDGFIYKMLFLSGFTYIFDQRGFLCLDLDNQLLYLVWIPWRRHFMRQTTIKSEFPAPCFRIFMGHPSSVSFFSTREFLRT